MSNDKITVNGETYIKEIKKPDEEDGYEYCIIRTRSAGVFAGWIDKYLLIPNNRFVIKNSRRIWYWDGAASLSQLAMEGVKKPDTCKFAMMVPETYLTEIIEVIPATTKAKLSIEGVAEWKV